MNKIKGIALSLSFIAGLFMIIFQQEIINLYGESTGSFLKYTAHVLLSVIHLYAIYVVFVKRRFSAK